MTDSARASSSSENLPEPPCEGDSANSTLPGLSAVELALGICWILLPSIQYYATTQRTALQLEGSAALPGLGSLDLTPFYAWLVAGTLILALARWMYSSRRGASVNSGGSIADSSRLGEESAP